MSKARNLPVIAAVSLPTSHALGRHIPGVLPEPYFLAEAPQFRNTPGRACSPGAQGLKQSQPVILRKLRHCRDDLFNRQGHTDLKCTTRPDAINRALFRAKARRSVRAFSAYSELSHVPQERYRLAVAGCPGVSDGSPSIG